MAIPHIMLVETNRVIPANTQTNGVGLVRKFYWNGDDRMTLELGPDVVINNNQPGCPDIPAGARMFVELVNEAWVIIGSTLLPPDNSWIGPQI